MGGCDTGDATTDYGDPSSLRTTCTSILRIIHEPVLCDLPAKWVIPEQAGFDLGQRVCGMYVLWNAASLAQKENQSQLREL
jgi:hypothetical protein